MSTETEQTVADLIAARAELVARGRCRGTTVDGDGRVCAQGAIGVATVEGYTGLNVSDRLRAGYEPRQMRVRRALESQIPADHKYADILFLWSDIDATDEDVLNLFDKALAELGGLG